ncbi:uncharacterized protein LOC144146873 [Haemaphysalis longicornis]
MASLHLAPLGCLLLAASAAAYVCSDFTGNQCCAATVFSTFRSGYLTASTGYEPQFAVPTYLRKLGGIRNGVVQMEIYTQWGRNPVTIGLTGRSDHYRLVFGSEPYNVQALRIPFAEYGSCYVAQFDDDRYGCRLFVSENASHRAVNRCLRGLARVCPGPLITTWNQQCVRGCSGYHNYLQRGFLLLPQQSPVFEQQQQQQQLEQVQQQQIVA